MLSGVRIGVLVWGMAALAGAGTLQKGKSQTPKQIFEQYKNSIVRVRSHSVNGDSFGTGFIVSGGQFVVTCEHVASDGYAVTVTTADGKEYSVTETLTDRASDLAILKLPTKTSYKSIPMGSYAKTAVGDNVVIIGNPQGLDRTLSTGIVSAKRVVDGIDVIQTNAASSPGSSGSPVINSRGEYVGFVSFQIRGGENLNMAVSSSAVTKLLTGKGGNSGSPSQGGLHFPSNGGIIPDTPLSTFGKTPEAVAGYEKSTGAYRSSIEATCESLSILGKALVKSDIAFDTIFDRHFKDKAGSFASLANWSKSDLEAVTAAEERATKANAKYFGGSHKEISKFFSSMRVAVKKWDAAKVHIATLYTEGKHGDSEELDTAWFELITKYGDYVRVLLDKPWFPTEAYYILVSPAVHYEMVGLSLEGIHADPAHDKGCYVSYSYDDNIKPGSKITGIRPVDEEKMTEVEDWGQVSWMLYQWKDSKEVMVQVEGASNGTFKVKVERGE